jgi:hypothetical protein
MLSRTLSNALIPVYGQNPLGLRKFCLSQNHFPALSSYLKSISLTTFSLIPFYQEVNFTNIDTKKHKFTDTKKDAHITFEQRKAAFKMTVKLTLHC